MNDLADFQDRKQALLGALENLSQLLEGQSTLINSEAERRRLARFRSELDGDLRFKVLCVGEFSTGKSTFINRFLLEDELLPAFPTPTTAVLTRVRHGDTVRAQLVGREGTVEEVNSDVAKRLRDSVSTAGEHRDQVQTVELESPAPRLATGIEVVDAPGLNDPDLERMQITLSYLAEADAILLFLNGSKPFAASEQQLFVDEVLDGAWRGRLFVIVNYWDLVPDEERQEVLDYTRQQLDACFQRSRADQASYGDLPIVPVSAKTGENTELVQEQIWDAIGVRKFTDVLSSRLQRFNAYLDRYCHALDQQFDLISQDRTQRARRRAQVARDRDSYRLQREDFLNGLRRALTPEFVAYRNKLEDRFDALSRDVDQLILGFAAKPPDAKSLNARLSAGMKRLNHATRGELRALDDGFLERIKTLVDEHKGSIDAPPSHAVSLDDYFLQWPAIANGWQAAGMNLSSGLGVAGILVGLGGIQSAVLTPVASPTLWTLIFGTRAAAVASPALAFGLPGLMLTAVSAASFFYLRWQKQEKIKQQLEDLSAALAAQLAEQKWALIDGLRAQQAPSIAVICEQIDHEIKQAYEEKVTELDALDAVTDQGEAIRHLRDSIDSLRLEVNP